MFPNTISVNIRDVLLFSQKAAKYHTNKRDFSALSYRLNSKSSYLFDGKKLHANTNHISFIPCGIAYDRVTSDENVIVFHFDTPQYISDEIKVFEFTDYEKYKTLFSSALAIWNEKEAGYKYRATAVFYEILAAMQKDCAVFGEPHGDFIRHAKEYIDAHFSDSQLSIQQLADDAFISSAYLRRRFRQRYQASPKQYLDAVRIQYAVSLLQTGYYTQSEIAERCGYSDVKYFRSLFRRKYGQSISAYCNSLLKNADGL